MRITVTLDPDVARALQRVREQKGLTLRETVNEALRTGLEQLAPPTHRRAFHTREVSLGPRVPSVDDVAGLLSRSSSADG